MKMMLLILFVIMLSGCNYNNLSKTVWDAQGCAYTLSIQTSRPSMSADDWQRRGWVDTPSIYRDSQDDKPACNSGEKNVQNH